MSRNKRELGHLKCGLILNPIVGLGRIQTGVVLPREQLAERESKSLGLLGLMSLLSQLSCVIFCCELVKVFKALCVLD